MRKWRVSSSSSHLVDRSDQVPALFQGAEAEASEDLAALQRQAQGLGFPLMVKAAAGGGGRGMRLVHEAAQLQQVGLAFLKTRYRVGQIGGALKL